jgi:hypothetical protein
MFQRLLLFRCWKIWKRFGSVGFCKISRYVAIEKDKESYESHVFTAYWNKNSVNMHHSGNYGR